MTKWLVLAAVMLIVELLTVGNLISIWFAFGAMIAAIVSVFYPSSMLEIFVFSLASLLSLYFVRPLAKKTLPKNPRPVNADRIIGERLRLIEAIEEEDWGQVRYNGTVWSAESVDKKSIEKGSLVEVVDIQGVKVIVKDLTQK